MTVVVAIQIIKIPFVWSSLFVMCAVLLSSEQLIKTFLIASCRHFHLFLRKYPFSGSDSNLIDSPRKFVIRKRTSLENHLLLELAPVKGEFLLGRAFAIGIGDCAVGGTVSLKFSRFSWRGEKGFEVGMTANALIWSPETKHREINFYIILLNHLLLIYKFSFT